MNLNVMSHCLRKVRLGKVPQDKWTKFFLELRKINKLKHYLFLNELTKLYAR